ncbi:glycosyltransferase family 4 protein [Arundinibacter roseus]|uniref:Glycosyltransferase n=1 Tax=Arundinibacter roseus TaxID=2070510 RepID=A0A4R4KA26_9BACT|nr:glycosyltransferase family 4 protein [Arundinibacter roseus]TDB63376.1 glycosyltransferase [Arundinibacter roseus]
MKILIVATLYYPYIVGGAEISTQILAESLSDMGHDVVVLTTLDKYKEDVIINDVTIKYLENNNIYWKYPERNKYVLKKIVWHFIDIYNISYKKILTNLISELNPDIIHTHNLCGISTIIWDVASTLKLKIVHTLRDYYLLCPQQSMMLEDKPCIDQCSICFVFSIPKKLLSSNVNAVVGISNFILNEHCKRGYFINAMIKTTLPNPVSDDFYERKVNNYNTVGYLGRISKEKGIELLIESFNLAKNEKSILLIAGSGDDKYIQQLRSTFESSSIFFLGKVESSKFLKSIDLLVVPSLWNEPFGRVVIEAYSMSCPVFVSNNGGLVELIVDGISKSFSTNDSNDLCCLLNDFFNCGFSIKNENFLSTFNRYSKKSIASAYLDIYSNILI